MKGFVKEYRTAVLISGEQPSPPKDKKDVRPFADEKHGLSAVTDFHAFST